MTNSHIYINYNLRNVLSKNFIDMFTNSHNCSFLGRAGRCIGDTSVYLNCHTILDNEYYNKYYQKMNIVYFGKENFPIILDKYTISYIYINCENYNSELTMKVIEYFNKSTESIISKIQKIVHKFNLYYLICYMDSYLFIYDKTKSIYMYSDVNNFKIITENNLKYFKENNYNLIPQENVNKFLML